MYREDFVLSDTDMFYNIVRSSPCHLESIDLLNRARHYLLSFKDENGILPKNIQDELAILNDEIKYQNKCFDKVSWANAVKDICGSELFQMVLSHVTEQTKQANINKEKRG